MAERADGWRALTVFGAHLGRADGFGGAAAIVLDLRSGVWSLRRAD